MERGILVYAAGSGRRRYTAQATRVFAFLAMLSMGGILFLSLWRTVFSEASLMVTLPDRSVVKVQAVAVVARGGVHLTISRYTILRGGVPPPDLRTLCTGKFSFPAGCVLLEYPVYPVLSGSVAESSKLQLLGCGFGMVSVANHSPEPNGSQIARFNATGIELLVPLVLPLMICLLIVLRSRVGLKPAIPGDGKTGQRAPAKPVRCKG